MLTIILRIIGLIFLMSGIVMVYDARVLTLKWFGFGDQNEATSGIKILGFLIVIISGIILKIYYKLFCFMCLIIFIIQPI